MKKIEYETYSQQSDGLRSTVCVYNAAGTIAVSVNTETAAFSDPAKLDALGDAIKRAAQALRDAQQLTFADLKPGDFFKFDAAGYSRTVIYMKLGVDRGYSQATPGDGCYTSGHMGINESVRVQKLCATFTPEGES